MRYVSWFGGWLGHLLTQRRADAGAAGRRRDVRPSAAELSNEDLFYLAMLGPHV
ncbi:hypothetical protein SSBR45G_60870 [Bradyrhizobium sp. SSBR45G]|uniref:hypothetical protein n=1 Tax=unclassified Bradyrhizobium TaxID=2631580 RepID=UPI002342BC7D|nr:MULTISPECIES: hypothetical protein [unclassified Bradyrhizobium]GLH81178.1 hypothetical protein SSBR45G_60870 [Bradyrhizobium sp. SSBR45G]GLH88579.1 hypothetical protein SSBR45R_60400 [Bradyrhizobium sp. SSBR45R]